MTPLEKLLARRAALHAAGIASPQDRLRAIINAGIARGEPVVVEQPTPEVLATRALRANAPYGEMCRDPKICAGKGYCPRDPNCGE